MTPDQIETMARRRLNAVGDTFWSQAEIIEDYLYACICEVAHEIPIIEATDTDTSVEDQVEYDYPDRAVEIVQVLYNGVPLQKIQEKLYHSVTVNDTTVTSGTPVYWREWNEQILLEPAPQSSGVTIQIRSYKLPARPSSGSTLEIRAVHHPLLVAGVAYYMATKEPGDPRTATLASEWERNKREIIRLERKRKRTARMAVVMREEDLINTNLGSI